MQGIWLSRTSMAVWKAMARLAGMHKREERRPSTVMQKGQRAMLMSRRSEWHSRACVDFIILCHTLSYDLADYRHLK